MSLEQLPKHPSYCDLVAELRAHLRISQEELAAVLSVTQAAVSNYEAGVTRPNPRVRAVLRVLRTMAERGARPSIPPTGPRAAVVDPWPARVRELRKRWNVPLAEFAQWVGVAPQAVRKWELGIATPRREPRQRLEIARDAPTLTAAVECLAVARGSLPPPEVQAGLGRPCIEYVGLRAPVILSDALTRLFSVFFRDTRLCWNLAGEGAEFRNLMAAVCWYRPAPPAFVGPASTVVSYVDTNELRTVLNQHGRYALAWRTP